MSAIFALCTFPQILLSVFCYFRKCARTAGGLAENTSSWYSRGSGTPSSWVTGLTSDTGTRHGAKYFIPYYGIYPESGNLTERALRVFSVAPGVSSGDNTLIPSPDRAV